MNTVVSLAKLGLNLSIPLRFDRPKNSVAKAMGRYWAHVGPCTSPQKIDSLDRAFLEKAGVQDTSDLEEVKNPHKSSFLDGARKQELLVKGFSGIVALTSLAQRGWFKSSSQKVLGLSFCCLPLIFSLGALFADRRKSPWGGDALDQVSYWVEGGVWGLASVASCSSSPLGIANTFMSAYNAYRAAQLSLTSQGHYDELRIKTDGTISVLTAALDSKKGILPPFGYETLGEVIDFLKTPSSWENLGTYSETAKSLTSFKAPNDAFDPFIRRLHDEFLRKGTEALCKNQELTTTDLVRFNAFIGEFAPNKDLFSYYPLSEMFKKFDNKFPKDEIILTYFLKLLEERGLVPIPKNLEQAENYTCYLRLLLLVREETKLKVPALVTFLKTLRGSESIQRMVQKLYLNGLITEAERGDLLLQSSTQ